eukprot:6181476-Pleurochrysis_carterae.AAC.1
MAAEGTNVVNKLEECFVRDTDASSSIFTNLESGYGPLVYHMAFATGVNHNMLCGYLHDGTSCWTAHGSATKIPAYALSPIFLVRTLRA